MKLRVILILILAICYNYINAQGKAPDPKKTYMLSSIFIGGKKNNFVFNKGHIVFNPKDNTSVCFTSCNFIQLKYILKGNQLKFTTITPSAEPCPDPLVGLESDFKENLPKVTSYVLKGKNLILFGGKDTLIVFHE